MCETDAPLKGRPLLVRLTGLPHLGEMSAAQPPANQIALAAKVVIGSGGFTGAASAPVGGSSSIALRSPASDGAAA